MKKICFSATEIMLPIATQDFAKWSVIACDQHTSDATYWKKTEAIVGERASTLHITLPEIYLEEKNVASRIQKINQTMIEYAKDTLETHSDCMIYVERTMKNGKIRHGLVGKIDLEQYDFHKDSTAMIRATEGTVLERIPPRVKIRKEAVIEVPHVMLLIEDGGHTVIEPLAVQTSSLPVAYDFDLMQDGGHISGYFVPATQQAQIQNALSALCGEDENPLLFAVGDGNHSLATAKTCYEELKKTLSPEEAAQHPARYSMVEIVNIHDEALEFEPIYRVLFDVEPKNVVQALRDFYKDEPETGIAQEVHYFFGKECGTLTIENAPYQLPVGTLQHFIDAYLMEHPSAKVDYIHGIDATKTLAKQSHTVGFLFKGMEKSDLFPTVRKDGVLPRKTFSMGEASEKRYYLECRKIL